jgi:hypothetical protein
MILALHRAGACAAEVIGVPGMFWCMAVMVEQGDPNGGSSFIDAKIQKAARRRATKQAVGRNRA